jgi:hypothetical protein
MVNFNYISHFQILTCYIFKFILQIKFSKINKKYNNEYSWILLLRVLSLQNLERSSQPSFIKVMNKTKHKGEKYVNKKPKLNFIIKKKMYQL